MSTTQPFDRYLTRYPTAAVLTYIVVVAALVFTAWAAIADIAERRSAVAAAADVLAQIEGRRPSSPAAPSGAPAGAGPHRLPVPGGEIPSRLQARRSSSGWPRAVTRVGGNVLSSQVDVKGPQSTDGYVSLIASCEMEQSALQQLLYDLESGMPFLFVEQLVAQATQAALAADAARMRVLLVVSGQWQGAKK